jgi:hypothetical protein
MAVLTKVRSWHPDWMRGRDGSKVAYFGPGQEHHAHARAERERAKGRIVEVEQAEIGEWHSLVLGADHGC